MLAALVIRGQCLFGVGPEPDGRDLRKGDGRVGRGAARRPVTVTGPVLLQPLTAMTSETGSFQFPRLSVGTYTVQFELPGIQDRRQGRHRRDGRFQREREHGAGGFHCAGNRDGHGREPDCRHEARSARSRRSRPRCSRAFRRRVIRGSSCSRRPASRWTARTSAATCRVSSPTTCRAAATPTNNKWSLDGVDITDMVGYRGVPELLRLRCLPGNDDQHRRRRRDAADRRRRHQPGDEERHATGSTAPAATT